MKPPIREVRASDDQGLDDFIRGGFVGSGGTLHARTRLATIIHLIDRSTPLQELVIRMGEVAKGLNAESLGDCADAHRRHSAEPEPVSRLRPPGECQHIARGGRLK